MSPRSLIAIVAALLLAALGLLWYTLSDTPAEPRDPALDGPGGAGVDVSAGGTGASTLAPVTPAAPEAPVEEPKRELVTLAETEAGGFAIPDDALWIDGRVIIPDGTPLDEKLRLQASGRRFGKDRKSPRKHLVEVERDGRFRVAFGAKTKKGFLSLTGRYLYLERKHTVDLKKQDGEVRLEPKLGGVIVGTILSPPGEEASQEIHDTVMLAAQSRGSGPNRVRRTAKPELDGIFELTGLPPAGEYHLDLSSSVFADLWKDGIAVRAGEVTEVELTLARGVRLAGRVVDENGVGLPGTELELENEVITGDRNSTTFREMVTAEDGTFEFTGLQPGEVTLRIRAEGREESIEELGGFEPGEVRDELLYRVSAGHQVGGRVLWPDGTPAVGAVVKAKQDEDDWNARQFTAEADAEGNFRLTGLGDRLLVVGASARRVLPIRDEGAGAGDTSTRKRRPKGPVWKGELRDVVPGTEGVIVILSPGSTLRGRVTDDTGAPVTRFQVSATPRSGDDEGSFDWRNQVNRNSRSESGEFELDGLMDGVWRVHVSGKGIVDSESRMVTMPTDVPLELRTMRAVRLAGVVQDPGGGPVAGARIELRRQDDPGGSTSGYTNVDSPDGRFEITDATPGWLTLTATASGWAPSEGIEFEVGPGEEREGLVLVMRRGARLTGEIHPAAEPVAGRKINVHNRGGPGFWQEMHSDEEGRFTFEGLPAGDFTVRLDPPPGDAAEKDWRLRGTEGYEVDVTLTEGGSAHVVLGEPAGGTILVHGRVTVGGQARTGLVMRCHRDDFTTAAACDEFGNYELKVDGPGQHSFAIITEDRGVSMFSRQIGEGASQREDFDLPGSSLAGICLGPGSQPVGGVLVRLERLGERTPGWSVTPGKQSEADGTFHFEFLKPGRYRLRAGGPGYFGREAEFAVSVLDDVKLEEGQSRDDLVIELGPGGALTGVVTRTDGSPVERVWIAVKDAAGLLIVDTGVECSSVDGSYTLPGIPAGTFAVSARTEDGASAAKTVKVSVGATSRADLVISE